MFFAGIVIQRCDKRDRTIGTLRIAILRVGGTAGRSALGTRRTCRAQLGANSCCTASSAGEATEISRARPPTRAMSQENILAKLATCGLLSRIGDCRILSMCHRSITPHPRFKAASPATEPLDGKSGRTLA